MAQSTVVSATTSEIADAEGWLVEDLGNGVFGITCQDENNQAMHSASNAGYKIVGWNTGASASRWYLTALETEQLSAEQQALEELIALSEDMLERVANVETTTEGFSLTEDNYYCNAPMMANWYGDKFEGYHVLFDKDYSTYLHTDYTGADSEDGLDHYLRVDLGEGNSASLFTFNYATRNSSNQNPTAITVEGCNEENGTYELITKLTRDADKLISGATNEYYSAVMGLSSKSYRFLRFMVTGTIQGATAGPSDNKHVYFVFSEFGVSKATCNVTALTKYSTLTNDDVTAAFNAIREAKFAYANATESEDYTAAYNALKDDYDKLVGAYKTGDQTALSTKKEELQTLIDKTTTLIGQCGEVTYTPAMFDGEALLQVTDANGKFYLSTNAQSNQEGPISGLIDGVVGDANSNTYFHTDYSGNPSSDGLDHYIQVNLGEKVKVFKFTYTNRYNTTGNYATKMTIWGSTDGTTFEEITRIEGLPTQASAVYNSEEINATKEYTYLRFMVTESTSAKKGGHYFFHMAEFDLIIGKPESYTAQLNQNIGEVTDDLLIAAYKENEEAKSTFNYATTELQVINAIAELQAQYDALETAFNELESELQTAVDAAKVFLNGTPQTVGYPTDTQRDVFQAVIYRHESVEAINNAKTAFVETTDVNLPEDGKAYKIKAWWKNEQRYMTFIEKEDASVFAGSDSAYVPVQDETKAVTFVCRKIGDDNTYAFVSDNGYYLGWQADGKENNTSQNFAVHGYDNTLKIQKGAENNNGTILSPADLFGTLNILGKNANEDGDYYHFMFNKSSKNYHSGNLGDMYYYDDKHTVYYTFEEVPTYTLNTIKMNKLEGKNPLLTGLEEGMSMSTFSAPYPTVTPSGITAYYAKAISTTTEDGESKDVAVLQKMRTAIPANQGVVLVGEKGRSGNFKMLPAAGEDVPADLDNHEFFRGTGAQSVEMGQNDYILGKGSKGAGFYKAKAGSTLAAGKAYFHFENAAQVRNFVLRFGGETTDIEDAVLAPATDNDAIYDLSGRRVNEVTKGGIYIKNGKKFIVK